MCPRTEEQLAQGEGASQPTEIFHTLMSCQEAEKKLHGPLGKWRPLFRVSPSDAPFFLHLYYFQAPATQATPFGASFYKKRFYFSYYHSYHVLFHYVMIWWW